MNNKTAILNLENYKITCNGCQYHHSLGCELNNDCSEAIYMAIEALKKVDKYRWHNVEEELPEQEGKYFVILFNGEYEVLDFKNDLYKFNNESFDVEYNGKKGFVKFDLLKCCYDDYAVLKWKEIE